MGCTMCHKTHPKLMGYRTGLYCEECFYKGITGKLLEETKDARNSRDFENMPGEDLSHLFWCYIKEYKRTPSEQLWNRIKDIMGGGYDNPTLINTIYHALSVLGIDGFEENARWKDEDK